MLIIQQSIDATVDFSVGYDDRLLSSDDIREFTGKPGDQHYRLLAYLSTLFSGRDIIDIGTHVGSSALALSYNSENRVYSFDIEDRMKAEGRVKKWTSRSNISFHLANLWDGEDRSVWRERVLGSAMIFMDIDPHDGPMELEFYRWLRRENYQGILVCDDIWYFKGMRDRFWYHIPSEEKVDVTGLGHWSGTGIVHFGHQNIQIFPTVPSRLPVHSMSGQQKSWTVVTAYFNLTKRKDASDAIKARPQSYYLKHAHMTMSLDQNLVVFCDSESKDALEALRPVHLKERTRYIVMDFDDFEIVQRNYDKITADRIARNYNPDNRNTVSYYLFCMTRYVMMKQVMSENPFGSTHFAWCNICIERMGWRSGPAFEGVWREFRDRFSTCYIDYQPKSLAMNWPEYFKWGRCGMCSGFFTGNKEYFESFCNTILSTFDEVTAAGYGHADEQLFSLVFFKKPEIFDVYLGDYTEMIVNYGWVQQRPEEPVKNVLRNLFASGEDPALLKTLCERWLDSEMYGACQTTPACKQTVQAFLASVSDIPHA